MTTPQANSALDNPHADVPTGSERPWPVVLLTAVGAWFAAVPLLAMVGMLLGDVLRHGVGAYGVGVLVLVGAVVLMRASGVALFVEQLAVPALLVGGGTLAMGVYRDLHTAGGSWVMLGVVLVLAAVLPKNWLRVLLGALAAGLLAVAVLPHWSWLNGRANLLMVLHGLLAVWLLALWLQQRATSLAALVEPLAAGWLLATLAGLVWLSGATFLVGGAVGSNEVGQVLSWFSGRSPRDWQTYAIQAGASALVVAGAAVGAIAWPTLRQFMPLAVAAVLAGLAWFMPLLGAVLLALMVCATTGRWRLASTCALAAAWIVGSFYYQLAWPLADKAVVLVVAAAVLGAVAWWDRHARRGAKGGVAGSAVGGAVGAAAGGAATDGHFAAQPVVAVWALLGGSVLTLLVANGAIWQKQSLIAQGQPLYLALAPVDPRSLMEGDYMRLRFPTVDAHEVSLLRDWGTARPRMVVQLDGRGVATVQRLHTAAQPLAANERLLELTPKDGNWVVVTDAWFFKEGEAQRWQAARFGEFRVLPDGRALLVGMADAALQPIRVDKF
ncbi:MAG: GDYXXLXY domain-containing protein [Burkholderiales bacterium]|nr:GDYXXLXY domain-containing protein [Burkholderiales bacterium]